MKFGGCGLCMNRIRIVLRRSFQSMRRLSGVTGWKEVQMDVLSDIAGVFHNKIGGGKLYIIIIYYGLIPFLVRYEKKSN